MFMNVTVRQIEGRRMPPQAKRAAVALVLVSPIFVSILVRRSLRGGGPVFVYVGITFAMLLLVAVSYVRVRSRVSEFPSNVDGPILLGGGTYREVFTFLHGTDDYQKFFFFGNDLRTSYSRVVIQPALSPMRFDFLGDSPGSLGTVTAPDSLKIVVWARGDKIKELELVLEGRTLLLKGQGSVVESGVG